MGFRDSVISSVDSCTDRISFIIEAAIDAVTDVPETAGNAVEDGLTWTGKKAGKIPVAGGFLKAFLSWTGRTVSSAFDLAGAVLKGVSSIVSNSLTGIVRTVTGIFTLNWPFLKEGLVDITSGLSGAVILIVGKLISLIQTSLYFLQPNERKLSAEENEILERVFRKSLARYNIRLIEGFAGIYSANNRPFTLGNSIYLKNRDISAKPGLLVHECVHVWQYRHDGARYVSDALGAQFFVADRYNWRKELRRGHKEWQDFNAESQGKFHENLYPDGELENTDTNSFEKGGGVFYDADRREATGRFIYYGEDHTDLSNGAVKSLREKRSCRLSQFLD